MTEDTANDENSERASQNIKLASEAQNLTTMGQLYANDTVIRVPVPPRQEKLLQQVVKSPFILGVFNRYNNQILGTKEACRTDTVSFAAYFQFT